MMFNASNTATKAVFGSISAAETNVCVIVCAVECLIVLQAASHVPSSKQRARRTAFGWFVAMTTGARPPLTKPYVLGYRHIHSSTLPGCIACNFGN